jgi:SAM-dependent methyltransferase
MDIDSLLEDNRANWDDRAAIHVASGYGIEELVADPTAISDVVSQDRDRLGDLSGADVIHLQCHLGTDTVSLARLGARRVVGLDFSGESLANARRIAGRCDAEVEFVQADVYDARQAVSGDFDLVYTGVGALCWLPQVRPWARTVASLLRPGGRFLIREGHPIQATIVDDISDGLRIEYPYFEQVEPLTWTQTESYVGPVGGAPAISHPTCHEWTHGIGEVVTALIDAGLVIDSLEEFDHMRWNAWGDAMVADADGYRLADHPERVPLEYVLTAHRPQDR